MRRRGEYKTPGGKLIAVEFAVGNGMLEDVVVTGDFFFYPEEALDLLCGALTGAPGSSSEAEFAARIDAALSGDVELLGSSARGLAIAVMRALHDPNPESAIDDR